MKHFYSFVLMCLVAVTLHAEAISESAARAIAGHQLRGDAVVEVSLSSVRKAQAVGATQVATPAYYVFNAEKAGDGFVIVSGDDRVAPILGYSDNGTFDPNNVPPAMQAMLDAYAEQIAALNDGATAAQNLTGKAAIKPMVTSRWNQSAPLNESLPMIGDKYPVTGCVATAMAQLMYYHKWPKNPTESIPAYKFYSSTQKDTIAAAELPSITFDWENMQDVYMVDVTGTVATKAVSDLMRYCGQSVEMVYGTSSSSASTSWVPRSLTDYFGYATSQYVQRICYTQAEWDNLVYDELKAGRPILYRGDKNPGGHAFLCDGYDGNGLFHFNWGWAGKSDGYFVLSVLNPDDQGTGSTAGPYGYIFGQSMIIGVQPGDAVGDGLRMTSTDLKNPGTTSLSRSSKAEDFSLTLTSRFTNYNSIVETFDFGWGVFDKDNELIATPWWSYSSSGLRPRYGYNKTVELNFGASLPNGTYRLLPISRVRGTEDWLLCYGAEVNYVEVTIDGLAGTVTSHGTAAVADYKVNDIAFEGTMNANKKVKVTLNLTNEGNTEYDMLYVYVDGTKTSNAVIDILPGETGTAELNFVPTTAGEKTVTFSLNSNGSDPIATRTITINSMPTVTLTNTALVTNTVNTNEVHADKIIAAVTFTNESSVDYDEDVLLKVYRVTYSSKNSGTLAQTLSQPLKLAAGETKIVVFEVGNLISGYKYFGWPYYFSNGGEVKGNKSVPTRLVIIPDEPEYKQGDVNGDGNVDVDDVNILINVILGRDDADKYGTRADVNGDSGVDVSDVNTLINLVLGK